MIRMLRGLTLKFGYFDDGQFNELRIEDHLSSNPALALAACWYWIRKLQALYLAGDYAAARDAASKAQRLLWTSSLYFEEAEYHFYGALAQAAHCDCAPAGERQQCMEALTAHHRQLQVWAENCPENFENRAALVGAEIARIEGRVVDAEQLYEQAIRSARTNGFVHNEGLAYEVAARFYAARGFNEIARLYLGNARYDYLRWGANGKVRQLDQSYPKLTHEPPVAGPTSTIGAPVEHLDLATVIKVSQAVSGEIVLEKLLDTLMRTAMAQAGAERVLLILARGATQRIAAEATTICATSPWPRPCCRRRCSTMSCALGKASSSMMPRPNLRSPLIVTSSSGRRGPFSACRCSRRPSLSACCTSKTAWRPACLPHRALQC
jgi:tetratricopeptide (TPR) repeat protein